MIIPPDVVDIRSGPAPGESSATEFTADKLAVTEERYIRASPEVKEKMSRRIEREPIGELLKRLSGFKCQVCEALGLNPIGFLKRGGEP
jgi:hypothetical protein